MDGATISIYVCLAAALLIPTVLVLGFIASKMRQAGHPDPKKTIPNGMSAPARIISVQAKEYPIVKKRVGFEWTKIYNYVDFEVEVSPLNGIPFRSKFTSLVLSERLYPELMKAGVAMLVRYDPADLTKIEFEKFEQEEDSRKRVQSLPDALMSFNQLDQKYVHLRISGQRATAGILECEKTIDLNPADSASPSVYRLTLEVAPDDAVPFKAESQLLVVNAEKFSVGNRVFVRFDPRDPTVVAIENF